MSVQLLDKTRKLNKLLHNNHSTKVVFNDICEVLMETLSSNILVISKKGKVLGISLCPGVEEITELIEDKVGGYVDAALNERLLGVLSTKENVNLQTLGFERPGVERYTAIICPIEIAGERLGTVFMYRCTPQYDIDDIIVSEYGTTVVGLEMMRSVNEENVEENRKVQVVKSAFNTLSFSELEAIIHIFDELNGDEGILVASKIADRVGITRSVIVNALRKFESAGVIESRSSGMKGTYIKVLNDYIFDELDEIKARKNLKANLKRVGLLGGIVWNEVTGNLVSGHQRISVIDEVNKYNPDTRTNDYLIRVEVVHMDEKTEKEQNIFMNNRSVQGDFDSDMLKDMLDGIDYSLAGLNDFDLNMLGIGDLDFSINDDIWRKEDILDDSLSAIDEATKEGKENKDINRSNNFYEDSKENQIVRHNEVQKIKDRISNQNSFEKDNGMLSYVVLSFNSPSERANFMKMFGYGFEVRYIDGKEFMDRIEFGVE